MKNFNKNKLKLLGFVLISYKKFKEKIIYFFKNTCTFSTKNNYNFLLEKCKFGIYRNASLSDIGLVCFFASLVITYFSAPRLILYFSSWFEQLICIRFKLIKVFVKQFEDFFPNIEYFNILRKQVFISDYFDYFNMPTLIGKQYGGYLGKMEDIICNRISEPFLDSLTSADIYSYYNFNVLLCNRDSIGINKTVQTIKQLQNLIYDHYCITPSEYKKLLSERGPRNLQYIISEHRIKFLQAYKNKFGFSTTENYSTNSARIATIYKDEFSCDFKTAYVCTQNQHNFFSTIISTNCGKFKLYLGDLGEYTAKQEPLRFSDPNRFNDFSGFFFDCVFLFFILLIIVTFLMSITVSKHLGSERQGFFNYLYFLKSVEIFSYITILTTSFITFLAAFESITFYIYLLIINWGSKIQGNQAGFYYLVYTVIGGFFLFTSFGLLILNLASTNFTNILEFTTPENFFYIKVIILSLFIGFGIKIPVVPFHRWLPEAHVEASTSTSVVLSGVLLKIGNYGLIRFFSPLMYFAPGYMRSYLSPFFVIFSSVSAFLASCIAFRDIDYKRIIAYMSVIHMNTGLVGFFSLSPIGYMGFIVNSLAHSFTSGSMFSAIGYTYNQIQDRTSGIIQGLSRYCPILSGFLFLIILTNVSFPFTLNFAAEWAVLISAWQISKIVIILLSISGFLNTCLSFLIIRDLLYGNVKNHYALIFKDMLLIRLPALILLPIFFCTFFLVEGLIIHIFPALIENLTIACYFY